MQSEKAGAIISDSKTEITNISSHGIWLFHEGKEFFLDYERFPWFKEAKVNEVINVQNPTKQHFYWPDLDVDLHLDSINNPENYPLVSKS